MKRDKIVAIAIIISVVMILVAIVLTVKKANDNRKRIVDQIFWGNFNPSPNNSASAVTETPKNDTTPSQPHSNRFDNDMNTQESEAIDGEKTAEQMYLEWEVYELLTDSIKDSRLKVNPLQIWCSNPTDEGRYLVYGIYYIGNDPHSITVYYESEGDGSTFDREDFHITEVIMDEEKVFPNNDSSEE